MIYLNNAATGFPKPPEVVEAVRVALTVPPHDARRAASSSVGPDPIEACRSSLADFFGISDAHRIAFASNATDALNMAIFGLGLGLAGGHSRGVGHSPGVGRNPSLGRSLSLHTDTAHVITTQADHNATLRPLRTLARDAHLELTIVPCDRTGRVSPNDIDAAMRPNTRAVFLSHASNVTGVVQDLRKISAVTHAHGALLVVDAAQSAGSVEIDVEKTGIDLLAFTGHKNLHGLQGVGGLYVREGVNLRPWRIGGTGIRSHEPYQPEEMPLRLEAGTLNTLGIISLKAGVDFIQSIGLEAIARRKRALVDALLDAIEAMPEIVVYGKPRRNVGSGGNSNSNSNSGSSDGSSGGSSIISSSHSDNHSDSDNDNDNDNDRTMIALNIEGIDPDQAGYILENVFSIIIRSGLHCAPLIHEALGSSPAGCLRISPSYFTSDEEVEATVEALKQLCRMRAEAKRR
ncbi:MAG: aminotransferase class V-fold PLP-dependent enzyme [Deltaproteobacteria bacterium]|nr:aminotransferase class V-fold PLP-dependent enzyme [Deltaproteobacteria bacterium]